MPSCAPFHERAKSKADRRPPEDRRPGECGPARRETRSPEEMRALPESIAAAATSGNRRQPGLRLRQFNLNPRAAPGLAVNQHSIVLVVEYFQPFFDVGDADTLVENRRKFRFRHANAVILNFN